VPPLLHGWALQTPFGLIASSNVQHWSTNTIAHHEPGFGRIELLEIDLPVSRDQLYEHVPYSIGFCRCSIEHRKYRPLFNSSSSMRPAARELRPLPDRKLARML